MLDIRTYYPRMKRLIDVVAASVFLLALSPLMLLIAALVRLTSTGPSLFWSERVGRHGEVFLMPKFRTMTTCSKVMSRELATDNDFKLTRIGGFIRKSSLDELPQLWSVLVGHMSLIGPRPLLPSDKGALLRQQYGHSMTIRPGITGLAQIKGRNLVSPRKKARYDAFYGRNMCLLLDLRILTSTLGILHRTDMVK